MSTAAAIVVGGLALRSFLQSCAKPASVSDKPEANASATDRLATATAVELVATAPPAGSVESDGGPEERFDRRFWTVWALPLLALTAVSTLGAGWLFIDAYPGAGEVDAGLPTGGLLLLIDAKAPGLDSQASALAVAGSVETWSTDSNASELLVKLNFPVTAAGSRWYIIASGQYYPDRKLNQNLFCFAGPRVIRKTDRIQCSDAEGDGSLGIEYRYNDVLGATDRDKITGPIDSLEGFDAKRAAIITGVVSAEPHTPTTVFIPYRTPRTEHPGGDEQVRLAPIGITDQEWGALHAIGSLAPGYADAFGEFADFESRQKLRYMPLSTLKFDVREDAIGQREIAAVAPPPVQADQLAWEGLRKGVGPISYRLHDPYSQDRVAVKAFGAGLIASVGAAALLLLLEQVLARWPRSS